MVKMEDEDYQKLKHDADDNLAVRSVIRWVAGIVIFCILYFTSGIKLVNSFVAKGQATIECDILVMQAKNAAQVRSIEQGEMSMDDYLRWYEIYAETLKSD